MQPWAQEIITALSSYTERSPSGAGVHIILAGKLPPGGRKRGHMEMYDRGRFFTMTGEHLEGSPRTIEPRQRELEALHRQVWPELYEPRSLAGGIPARGTPGVPLLDDEEVLARALGANNVEKFAQLWYGAIRGYDNDHSRADLALCCLLAF